MKNETELFEYATSRSYCRRNTHHKNLLQLQRPSVTLLRAHKAWKVEHKDTAPQARSLRWRRCCDKLLYKLGACKLASDANDFYLPSLGALSVVKTQDM